MTTINRRTSAVAAIRLSRWQRVSGTPARPGACTSGSRTAAPAPSTSHRWRATIKARPDDHRTLLSPKRLAWAPVKPAGERDAAEAAAVARAALILLWSSGQAEGQINRLKRLKRQMYGRANLELLRRRTLLAA
ncbi:hypothetical protein [Azospirillum himalayense]|uniref:hypothetical protein n=1 Tax=Azospirillum himalayense TaxID=654847 RepID=UPI00366EBF18